MALILAGFELGFFFDPVLLTSDPRQPFGNPDLAKSSLRSILRHSLQLPDVGSGLVKRALSLLVLVDYREVNDKMIY